MTRLPEPVAHSGRSSKLKRCRRLTKFFERNVSAYQFGVAGDVTLAEDL